jgi:TonB-linked SusC/RagA family outer membrane protein
LQKQKTKPKLNNINMKKEFFIRKIFILLIFSTYCNIAFGQGANVGGTITDKANGSPMPGVTVIIKGTTKGVISDIDGKYSLKAENTDVLVFSFVGYLSQEAQVNGRAIIDVALSEETKQIDELIVIGYGTQKKSDKTGAVAHITSEELNTGAMTDPIQSIQGKLSGVSISKKGGDPNSGFAVTIRGAISISGSTDPLYVIDGIPGADPTTIASEDIESYNVLKDASSTAIYGSRGSNGVIIITTKGGKNNKGSLVEFNSYFSLDKVAKRLDLMTADDWRAYATSKGLTFNDGGANTDWQSAMFRNGVSHTNNFAISGGNENSSYRVSFTESNYKGVVIGSDKKRQIGRIDLTQKGLENRLTVITSLSGTLEGNNYISYGGNGQNDVLFQAYQRNPSDPIYNSDGSFYELQRDFNYWNPVAIVKKIQDQRDAKRFTGNIKADLDIFKGLVASINLGYFRNDNENFYFQPTTLASNPLGFGKRSYDNYYSKILESTIAYSNKFAIHIM